MTAFVGADVLIAILVAAFLQDLAYTAKTVLVSRGRRKLAMAADVFAMVASSLYLILTASVTIRSGVSVATVEAFAAIAVGGAGGTIAGMLAANWLERQFTSASAGTARSIEDQKTLAELTPAAFSPSRAS
jgi:drug/metabolite transporter (DMT)-like permease